MRFTASQIRDIAEWAGEVADRDGSTFQLVLERTEAGIDPALEDAQARRAAFYKFLKESRLPDFTRKMDELTSSLAPINGVPGIRINTPPYLEGDEFSALISFRNGVELESKAGALIKYARGPDMAKAEDLLG